MTDTTLFESICKQADESQDDLKKLHELWSILRVNKARLSDAQFDFAREHLDNYYSKLEDKIEVENLKKSTTNDLENGLYRKAFKYD